MICIYFVIVFAWMITGDILMMWITHRHMLMIICIEGRDLVDIPLYLAAIIFL